MLILKENDVDSYQMAQVVNQSWIEAEDLTSSPADQWNVQHI